MTGAISVGVAPGLLVAFLLALVRATAWVSVAPPFSSPAIPRTVKVAVSVALAIAVAPHLSPATAASAAELPVGTSAFVGAIVEQALTGVALGLIVAILFAAVSSAGALIDLASGLNLTSAMDPLNLEQQPIIGRIYSLVATTLLFASGSYLLLVKGFVTSFDSVPLTGVRLGHLNAVVLSDVATMFLSALEIAAPLLAVLFLTDVVLGLLARAAPQMNILSLSMSIKVLLAVLLVGVALPFLPGVTETLIERAVRDGLAVLRP